MKPTWEKEGIQLYLGDCLEVLPTLGRVDAVITDPPYGINAARTRNSQKYGWVDYGCDGWDLSKPDAMVFEQMFRLDCSTVVWGGNYFTDSLPPSSKWLIWDKGQTDFSLADVELAWCSWGGAMRRILYPRSLAIKDGKVHPTQKPIAVMVWCVKQVPDNPQTILDPFMGSGTTGVACVKLGRKFIGIEKEPKYYDIAVERIKRALDEERSSLFPVAKEVQAELFAAEQEAPCNQK